MREHLDGQIGPPTRKGLDANICSPKLAVDRTGPDLTGKPEPPDDLETDLSKAEMPYRLNVEFDFTSRQ